MYKHNPAAIGNDKYRQGVYEMKNPQKYIGNNPPVYRSSWEYDFMQVCDLNPAIFQWASEPFPIQYTSPFDMKLHSYWPDFIVRSIQTNGKLKTILYEVKPRKQTMVEHAKSKRDKMALQLNAAKWQAAHEYAQAQGMDFYVVTEDQLYTKRRNR